MVGEMKEYHPRNLKNLREHGVDRVICPVMLKAKYSGVYNQQTMTNIISIIKTEKLPDDSTSVNPLVLITVPQLDHKLLDTTPRTYIPKRPKSILHSKQKKSPFRSPCYIQRMEYNSTGITHGWSHLSTYDENR